MRKPEDMAGMTVRVPPNTMWLETFKAMGGRPTTVQWSEVYNALQQNVVTSAEAPLGSLWGSKLHEVRKVISMTGHFTAFVMWPINAGYFNKLAADVQRVLLEEGRRAGDEKEEALAAGTHAQAAGDGGCGGQQLQDVRICSGHVKNIDRAVAPSSAIAELKSCTSLDAKRACKRSVRQSNASAL